MNLLEGYIIEIHSVKPYKDDLLLVDVTFNCYGNIQRREELFGLSEWEKVKERGWFWT